MTRIGDDLVQGMTCLPSSSSSSSFSACVAKSKKTTGEQHHGRMSMAPRVEGTWPALGKVTREQYILFLVDLVPANDEQEADESFLFVLDDEIEKSVRGIAISRHPSRVYLSNIPCNNEFINFFPTGILLRCDLFYTSFSSTPYCVSLLRALFSFTFCCCVRSEDTPDTVEFTGAKVMTNIFLFFSFFLGRPIQKNLIGKRIASERRAIVDGLVRGS